MLLIHGGFIFSKLSQNIEKANPKARNIFGHVTGELFSFKRLGAMFDSCILYQ